MDINDLVLSEKALAVIDKGEWMPAGEEAPDLEFLVTGLQSEGAQKLMEKKLLDLRKKNRNKPLTQKQINQATKEVLVEEVLRDWRGLTDGGKDIPYSKALAEKYIMARGGSKFYALALTAAEELDREANSFVEDVTKN